MEEQIEDEVMTREEWVNSFSDIGGRSSIHERSFEILPIDWSKVIQIQK